LDAVGLDRAGGPVVAGCGHHSVLAVMKRRPQNSPKEQPTAVEPKKGIIGLFDILGYENFLENNSEEKLDRAAIRVIEFIAEADTIVKKQLIGTVKGNIKLATRLLGEVESIAFSDTILMTSAYANDADEKAKQVKWNNFIFLAIAFSRYMFDYGLPVRGVISFGQFLVKKNCFAGKPIVEAFQLSRDMDVSATVLTHEARRECQSIYKFNFWQAVEYLVPRKSGIKEKLMTLNIASFPREYFKPWHGDLSQIVAESFWAHNKDISPNEFSKLRNTEMFLRYLKKVVPGQFRDPREELNPANPIEKLRPI